MAPTVINTFLEKYAFSGKKIILVAASGGSGFGNTVAELKGSVSESAELIEGDLLNGQQTYQSLTEWADGLKL